MRPTRRLVLVLLLETPVALLPALLGGWLWPAWLAVLGATLLLAALDLVLAPPPRSVAVDVDPPALLHPGEVAALEVRARARGRAPAAVEGLLEVEGPVPSPGLVRTAPDGGGVATLSFPLAPFRRGAVRVPAVWLRWQGPFGLLERRARVEAGIEVPVVPDARGAQRDAIRLLTERTWLEGGKLERFVGEGSEFESLREYVPGHDAGAIDWRATARSRRLIVQERRAERDHSVVVALDAGRLMGETLDGRSRLDHAVHAGLALAWAALKTGDRVGLFAFDEVPRAFLAPRAGARAFSAIERATGEVHPRGVETNFTLGLTDLLTRLKRRSLVVVLTDFVDTVTAELMVENVARLARRHLVLFVALEDAGLERTVLREPRAISDVYRAVAADELVRERERVLARLRRLGVQCLSAPPRAVTSRVLARYLEVKRREMVG
jgi:uncharacterized protein (DUF58 family)